MEHLEHGLPTEAALERWLSQATIHGERWSLRYHGDFRITNEQFKLIVTARRRPTPAAMWAFGCRRLKYRPDTQLRDRAGPYTNASLRSSTGKGYLRACLYHRPRAATSVAAAPFYVVQP